MSNIYKQMPLGDMELCFTLSDNKEMGIQLLPLNHPDIIKKCETEPAVQVYIRGDRLPSSFINGHSMRCGGSVSNLKFISQTVENVDDEICIRTLLREINRFEIEVLHFYTKGLKAIETKSILRNISDENITIEMLSSFSIGGLTPFNKGEAQNSLLLHRARSVWSMEGRIESIPIEDLQLEPSWNRCAIRTEKFGQIGSMPVRKYFPFAAVEDTENSVTWAVQLACGSSWQLELSRKDNGLSISGGIADYDFGHWCKELKPGEFFETPSAVLTVYNGNLDVTCQRLLTVQDKYFKKIDKFEKLPVIFNEFCTTWGVPSHENILKIVSKLRDHEIDYFIIDAGWYANEKGWGSTGGDWEVSSELFPDGIDKTVNEIENAGLKPGIWFEPETCAQDSKISKNDNILLKRNGFVIDTGARRFLDMRSPKVQTYLNQKVIDFLKNHRFKYVKIDYNDTIGVGCDGNESLGEGLRQNILGTQLFFGNIKKEIPDIIIENCSSGGHRLEPSMLAISNISSFSDAHECLNIPIIAANLHRLVLPSQSQIWAVIRDTDTLKRIYYSLINTFLGVMCLSGDILNLSTEQWQVIDSGIAFYKQISHIIKSGISKFYGTKIKSYNYPEGWQAVIRTNSENDSIIIIHTFDIKAPLTIELPVMANEIISVFSSENNCIELKDNMLSIQITLCFEAVAIHVK